MWQLKDGDRDIVVCSQYDPVLCPEPCVAISTGSKPVRLSIEEARELTAALLDAARDAVRRAAVADAAEQGALDRFPPATGTVQ